MLKEQIDNLIKQAMLDKDSNRVKVLRAIKSEFLVYQTAKNAKPLDDAAEFTILRKMVKQRLDSRDQYIAGGRKDLADSESKEILVLESFLPREATAEDINKAIFEICQEKGWCIPLGSDRISPQIPKKSMGEAIKLAKAKLDNVDGKLLADTIKSCLV
jgi:uncharacterized protein YqeY|nr:MAG TPA: YqeY-like protein [Bacteriophage sp.]